MMSGQGRGNEEMEAVYAMETLLLEETLHHISEWHHLWWHEQVWGTFYPPVLQVGGWW